MAKEKKAKKDKAPKAAKPQSVAGSPQQSLLIGALGSALVVALASAALLFLVLQGSARVQLNQYAQARAEGAANLLEQLLLERQAHLDSLGTGIAMLEASRSNDAAAIANQVAVLHEHFPKAFRAHLVPLDTLGASRIAISETGLRNNIEVDLARRAFERSDKRAPELYKLGNDWVMSIAAPIAASPTDSPVGILFISFDQKIAQTVLEKLSEGQGSLELLNNFQPASPASVTVAGNGGSQGSGEAKLFNYWLVKFVPSNAIAQSMSAIPLMGWIIMAVAALLAGVIAFVAHRQLLGVVAGEAEAIQSYLSTLVDSPNNEPPLLAIPALKDLSNDLAGQLRKLATAKPAPAAKPGASKKAAEAEAPAPAPAKEEEMLGDPLFQEMEITDLDSLEDLEDSLVLDDTGFLDGGLGDDALPAEIFRAYDIRGMAESQLSASVAYRIGRAIGSEAQEKGQTTVAVGRDGRISSPMLRDNLVRGLTESGCDVIDIGVVPSPVLYFATYQLKTNTGVMITGSHNPAQYNGMKIVIAGQTLAGDRIQDLRERIEAGNFTEGSGQVSEQSVSSAYIERITGDVAIAQPLKVVVDAGNGAAGEIAPQLLRELGCDVIPLYCEIDGTFPNHHPDPSETKNLQDLIAAVRENGADLGVAFDGDGDRIGVVTASGQIVMPDRLLMLFSQDIVARNPGADIIFDIKCTRLLNQVISNYGGRPIMWRSGHSHIKEKMVETGALLGGELSGHIFFKERWYGFDDGIYSAARLIEILSTSINNLDDQLAEFPESLCTPEIKIAVSESEKFDVIDKLAIIGNFGNGKVSTIDGVRVDFDDGWGLVRASNTTPCLTLRFEADDDGALQRIQDLFRAQLTSIDSNLSF
ncbi:MAG: phosphomannomutase/phosphoglucomutase [Gammaproteobacteria bacterium]|nr:MAG: phosphomannomutase/phosphoglucomutase [Gammaproteobacteria bacterium]